MATEKELREKVANWGNAYKGIKEGSTQHKELINMFNNSGLCTRYKMTTSDAWCAMFVSCAFIATGLTDIFPCIEVGCANMITLAQKAGIWVENDAYVPSIGDVIEYDWQDSGSGDNTGNPDHVGIVQSISGSSFVVIEGNKSDTVGTRTMQVNGKYIRGFITPDYAKAASGGSTGSTSSSGNSGSSSGSTTKSSGSSGSSDKDFTYTDELKVDGEIGKKTVMRLQTLMGKKGTDNVDGFIDGQQSASKKYWSSILTEACKWTGGASPVVKSWQQYLINKGYSCGKDGADGKLGQNTARASQQFLIDKGYSCGKDGADGKFGKNSAMAFQKFLNANR